MHVVELLEAKGDGLNCIENMMQFYMYDFSEWLPIPFNSAGLFTLRPKEPYWAAPSTKPFLIMVNGETAGFVCVDNEVNHVEVNFNIGYFFVSRRFRGAGIGLAVVEKLLARFPGCWQIFHINKNLPAERFWKKVIPLVTHGDFSVRGEHIDDHDCTLYQFRHGETSAT